MSHNWPFFAPQFSLKCHIISEFFNTLSESLRKMLEFPKMPIFARHKALKLKYIVREPHVRPENTADPYSRFVLTRHPARVSRVLYNSTTLQIYQRLEFYNTKIDKLFFER